MRPRRAALVVGVSLVIVGVAGLLLVLSIVGTGAFPGDDGDDYWVANECGFPVTVSIGGFSIELQDRAGAALPPLDPADDQIVVQGPSGTREVVVPLQNELRLRHDLCPPA